MGRKWPCLFSGHTFRNNIHNKHRPSDGVYIEWFFISSGQNGIGMSGGIRAGMHVCNKYLSASK